MNDDTRDNPASTTPPLKGALGSHPVSTGLGAAAGGMAAGAAIGTVAGPIGTIAGATAGAIIGGVTGNAIGKAIDPTVEEAHWKKNFTSEPYYQAGMSFDEYAPAYRTGYQGRAQHVGRKFDDVERDLETSYNRGKGNSKLGWDKAKVATRAAWDRIERMIPGDSDHDGK
jgi:phage tail tape-measure protein